MKRFIAILALVLVLFIPSWAATELKHTVKPSGGDFTTLAAAVDHLKAAHANLVTADVYATIEIDGTWSSADTAAVTITGLTTDATHYLLIYTTTAARHLGEYSTSYYRLELVAATAIVVSDVPDVKLEGLQVKITTAVDYQDRKCIQDATGSSASTVDRCIFWAAGVSGGGHKLTAIWRDTWGTAGTYKIQNCTFIADSTSGDIVTAFQAKNDSSGTTYLYNNTIKNFKLGIDHASGTNDIHLKNCGFVTCTTRVSGSLASDVTNSISTPTFESGKAFHLDSADTVWKDQGTDLSADAGRINTLDLDGVARTGTWDIGADEYAAAGGPTMINNILIIIGLVCPRRKRMK